MMPIPGNANVHLIFDCDGTLINAGQISEGGKEAATLSRPLVTLCVELIRQKRLTSITISTHQDVDTLHNRLIGFEGIDREQFAKTVSWQVAESLEQAIHAETGETVDVQVCLQPDIYPTQNKQPHHLGHTATLIRERLTKDSRDSTITELKTTLGETSYLRSSLGEDYKATQTAFVLRHIMASHPTSVQQVIYVDDTYANLVERHLPTRAWLAQQIAADQAMLEKQRTAEPVEKTPYIINTLENRLAILQDALAIDSPHVVFEAYHFRHELERKKAGDPEKNTFNLVYSSNPSDRKKTDISVEELLTQIPQPIVQEIPNMPSLDNTQRNQPIDRAFEYKPLSDEQKAIWRDYAKTITDTMHILITLKKVPFVTRVPRSSDETKNYLTTIQNVVKQLDSTSTLSFEQLPEFNELIDLQYFQKMIDVYIHQTLIEMNKQQYQKMSLDLSKILCPLPASEDTLGQQYLSDCKQQDRLELISTMNLELRAIIAATVEKIRKNHEDNLRERNTLPPATSPEVLTQMQSTLRQMKQVALQSIAVDIAHQKKRQVKNHIYFFIFLFALAGIFTVAGLFIFPAVLLSDTLIFSLVLTSIIGTIAGDYCLKQPRLSTVMNQNEAWQGMKRDIENTLIEMDNNASKPTVQEPEYHPPVLAPQAASLQQVVDDATTLQWAP